MSRDSFVVQFRFSRAHALWALALALLCVHPGELGSEQLTLTTYYPAPYGVYRDMLTTMTTTLSRDGGTTAIGAGGVAAGYKSQVNGSQYVTGTSMANTLVVNGNATVGGNLGVGSINVTNLTATNLWATNATIGTNNVTQLNLTNGVVNNQLWFNGYMWNVCVTRYYGAGTWGCAWNETALNNWPTGFSVIGPLSTIAGNSVYISVPNVDGWMWCCRFR
ncbi:MAG: hypothetical protein WC969_13310 [Elusimicrobiota bacterium]|jgi:hypothetical protein